MTRTKDWQIKGDAAFSKRPPLPPWPAIGSPAHVELVRTARLIQEDWMRARARREEEQQRRGSYVAQARAANGAR
jgi:hypothetical protein